MPQRPAVGDFDERSTPVPLPFLGERALEGGDILEEVGGAAGPLLWEAYRAAHLRAAVAPDQRDHLADPAAEHAWAAEVMAASLPRRAEVPLLTLAALWRDPRGADADRVMLALRTLSQWAGAQGWPMTGALLAEAAATLTPRECGAAYAAGRAFVEAGAEEQALQWFHFALVEARAQGLLHDVALLLDSIGEYYYRRGNLKLAERLHLRAYQAARRGRARIRAAAALHNLALTAGERGALQLAANRGRRAARLYGEAHPNLPGLVHDLAYIWMIHGHFRTAYPLLEALLPHIARPARRVRTVGNLARAAAGSGDRDAFERAWAEVAETLRVRGGQPAWTEALADALVECAQGAVMAGEARRALWALEQAEPLARRSRRSRDLLVIDAVREAAEAALTPTADASAAPVVEADPVFEEHAAHYAAVLARRPAPAA